VGALPQPSPSMPIEGYAASELADGCLAETAQPGVAAFRDFIVSQRGGGTGGIWRPCGQGGASEHKQGRAWDWPKLASSASDAQDVQDVLDWLLATDAAGNVNAMLRRAGVMYVIWNHQIWSVKTKSWQPYPAPGSSQSSPHTDHVHFSFGWPGALGQTSLYTWLRGGEMYEPAVPGPSPVAIETGDTPFAQLVVALVAAVVGYFGVRAWRRAS